MSLFNDYEINHIHEFVPHTDDHMDHETRLEAIETDFNNIWNTPIITIWAEENGSLGDGNFEWSFGNGSENKGNYGYPMCCDGRIISASISVITGNGTAPGEVRVAITINGNEKIKHHIINPSGKFSSTTSFFGDPIEVEAGWRINFKTKTNNSSVTHAIVSLLIELNLYSDSI